MYEYIFVDDQRLTESQINFDTQIRGGGGRIERSGDHRNRLVAIKKFQQIAPTRCPPSRLICYPRHMRTSFLLLILLLGCAKSLPIDYDLLAEDRENKELEIIYLNEIRLAQENNDIESYEFYLMEYFAVPRLEVPDHMKSEPEYFWGGESIKY